MLMLISDVFVLFFCWRNTFTSDEDDNNVKNGFFYFLSGKRFFTTLLLSLMKASLIAHSSVFGSFRVTRHVVEYHLALICRARHTSLG